MKELFVTFDQFMKEMGYDNLVSLSFEEFKSKLMKVDAKEPVLAVDWLKTFPEDDPRHDSESYIQAVYEFFYDNPKELLKRWFDSHIAFELNHKTDRNAFIFKKFRNIIHGNTIDGKYNIQAGRIVRNLFYKGIYLETDKANGSGTHAILEFFNAFYLRHELIKKNFMLPSMYEVLKRKDHDTFFAFLRGTYNKASIFNPYTYSYILNQVVPGKKLLCPVMSWCSPVIALHNSGFEELVAIDVIPNVIETAGKLHEHIESQKNMFDEPKTATFYCCPSEKIDKRYDFSKKYKDYFDTVFFSPPYFSVELYTGGEQSHLSFPKYEDWLEGYWRPTVELCSKVLKPGATFSFVIVPYFSDYGTNREISHDMLEIAEKYFTLDKKMYISWGGFGGISQNHDKRKNLVEDFFIMKKP